MKVMCVRDSGGISAHIFGLNFTF